LSQVQRWTISEAIYALGAGAGAATISLLGAAIAIASDIFLFTIIGVSLFIFDPILTVPVVTLSIVVVLSHPRFSQNRELLILIEALAWVMIPMTVQGTEVVYVDGFNFLDISIVFFQQLIPL
jgi:hypothetical protein